MRFPSHNTAHYVGLDQRLAPRSDVYCRVPFTQADGNQDIGTCVNISADGLLLRYDRGMEIGDPVTFKLPIIGRVTARVIWSLGGKTGFQFDAMIGAADFLPMLRAMGGRAE